MSAMTNTDTSDRGYRQDQLIGIEVKGRYAQSVKRKGSWTIKVPFYRLSQTISNLKRMGAKIAKVEILSAATPQPQKHTDFPRQQENISQTNPTSQQEEKSGESQGIKIHPFGKTPRTNSRIRRQKSKFIRKKQTGRLARRNSRIRNRHSTRKSKLFLR